MGRTTPTSTGSARPTGGLIWLRVNASVVLDDTDEPAFIRSVAVDITALKEAEAERARSLSLLQATLDASADAIFVADLEGKVTASNRPFGSSGRCRGMCSTPATVTLSIASVADRMADPDEFLRREAEITARTGRSPPTTSSSSPTAGRSSATRRRSGSAARSSGACGRFRDITEKLAAQEALSESDQRHRETLETIALIGAGIDAHGTVTFANDFLLELTGWSREEVVGHDWFDLFDDNPYVRADLPGADGAGQDQAALRGHDPDALRRAPRHLLEQHSRP